MPAYSKPILAVLDRLRTNLNLGETPDRSNGNFIVTWYNEIVEKIGDGPWCEMTNTWAMWTGGAKSLKNGRAYTVWACQDAVKKVNGSSWHWGTSGMRAGDHVYYDWSGRKGDVAVVDHTGTVEKIFGDGTFYVFEGNVDDHLRRMRRDGRHVVGYVRFDWDRLASQPSVAQPIPNRTVVKPKADKNLVLRVQSILKASIDGQWGPKTDALARNLRNAARARVGWPKKTRVSFDVKEVQRVIGTKVDGDFGPRSQAALCSWVKAFQRIAHVPDDAQWGPRTDNAFLAIRARCNNNY